MKNEKMMITRAAIRLRGTDGCGCVCDVCQKLEEVLGCPGANRDQTEERPWELYTVDCEGFRPLEGFYEAYNKANKKEHEMTDEEKISRVLKNLKKDGISKVCSVCEEDLTMDNCPEYEAYGDGINLSLWEQCNINCAGFRPIKGFDEAYEKAVNG